MAVAANGKEKSVWNTVKWSDNSVHLREVAKYPMPSIVRIIKGQYRNIGVAKSVYSELFINSVRTTTKVLAECVKVKEGFKAVPTDPKLSIPTTYQGWFELLSEDGRATKPFKTVKELAKSFPNSCLVRETIDVFIASDNGDITLENTRTVNAGEALTLMGDITVPKSSGKGSGVKIRLLRCFDSKGESVYLNFEQKGLFSPIAGKANIAGVHNLKGLLEKFRLPVTVRLVHGHVPSRVEKTSFTGAFRLLQVYTDETAFVCPVEPQTKMVPISTREALKLVVATNINEIKSTREFSQVKHRCNRMLNSYLNSIHILVDIPELKSRKEEYKIEQLHHTPKNTSNLTPEEEDLLFREVDDLYSYVRDGGPLPPRPRAEGASREYTDWWEEPAYESLDQFQISKPNADETTTGKKEPNSSDPNYKSLHKFQTQRIDENESSGKKVYHFDNPNPKGRSLSFVKDEPMDSTQRTQEINAPYSTSSSDPPPVPPKRFDSITDQRDSSPTTTEANGKKRPTGSTNS